MLPSEIAITFRTSLLDLHTIPFVPHTQASARESAPRAWLQIAKAVITFGDIVGCLDADVKFSSDTFSPTRYSRGLSYEAGTDTSFEMLITIWTWFDGER